MEVAESEPLESNEQLGCDSPVMWPDQNFFGDFNPLHLSPAPAKWLMEVQKDDRRMINEFASLTHSQLMEKVRALQNLAYQLGIEEAKQMSRGQCLSVFSEQQQQQQQQKQASATTGGGGGGGGGGEKVTRSKKQRKH